MHRFACMALLLLLSGLTWPTLASPAQDTRPVIRVGFYDFPPYSYEDRQGRAQGSLLALTQRLLEQAGYRAELRMLPVARLYAGLQNGSVHVWPGAPGKPELQGYTLESRHRLGHIGLHLYFRADTAPPALPHGLTGRGLILISGYSYWAPYSQWLTDPSLQLQLHRTSSHAAALAMLQRQRGDFHPRLSGAPGAAQPAGRCTRLALHRATAPPPDPGCFTARATGRAPAGTT